MVSKAEYINYRVSKSKETYEDALILAEKGRWNSCVNRLYYSAYYLVSALLYQNR
ncbi:MAG: HEPN domain-containing protein [Bacteroidales bacterium]|nr:HEPN domain-containing protein [Bacteroidales bacterium]